jgi:hypothetical protein
MEAKVIETRYLTAHESRVRLRLNTDVVLVWALRGRFVLVGLFQAIVGFSLAGVVAALEARPSPSNGEVAS